MKITRTGPVTILPEMRRKHGVLAEVQVRFVARPDGVLVVKVAAASLGKHALTNLLRGGKTKGRAKDWLRLTRESPVFD